MMIKECSCLKWFWHKGISIERIGSLIWDTRYTAQTRRRGEVYRENWKLRRGICYSSSMESKSKGGNRAAKS